MLPAGAQESIDQRIELQVPPSELSVLRSPSDYMSAAAKAETLMAAENCMLQWIKTVEMVRNQLFSSFQTSRMVFFHISSPSAAVFEVI